MKYTEDKAAVLSLSNLEMAFEGWWEQANLDRILDLTIPERDALIEYHWEAFMARYHKLDGTFEAWEARQMQNPEFRAEVEKLEPAFQVANMRMKRGLSQKELAVKARTRKRLITRIEDGKHSPSIDVLLRIAKALDAKLVIKLTPIEFD